MAKPALRIESHIPALRRYAWALVRRSDEADDLVQDCLERAIARAGTFRAEGEMRAWLFSILHNLLVSERRRAARRRSTGLDEAPEISVSGGQEGAVRMREVLAAIDTLPEEQRAVLLLVGVEDLGYAEAARVLDVPVGTVMSRPSRGRERLRQALEDKPQERLRIVT
jgi:RNA polymerase sigma-70 factor (ECF subfamily)